MLIIKYNPKYFLSLIKIFFFTTFFHSYIVYGEDFHTCFPKKYNFSCENPSLFLQKQGIDVKKDILHQDNLIITEKQFDGGSTGSIYSDSQGNIYYVKQANVFTEFIGSRLLNLIMGTKCTPIVKLINNDPHHVASLKLKGFKTKKESNVKKKKIKKAADLSIAMDFIGLADRHKKNMGYVKLNSNTLLSARIDCDTSFAFEIKPTLNTHYNPISNHLNFLHLFYSIEHFPEEQIIKAIEKIIAIPDEEIIMTIFQCWVTLSEAGHDVELEKCFNLARKLIERKTAFAEGLKNKNSKIRKALEKARLKEFFGKHY